MSHSPLFHPQNLNEAQHQAVGAVKGLTMEQRWEEETPVFAKAILRQCPEPDLATILDYGCGPGRLARGILAENAGVHIIGVDDSEEMLQRARDYVADSDRFITVLPEQLDTPVDGCYLVYCLQHIPGVQMREVLQRVWTFLKDDGFLFYCSSENRMAMRFDEGGFFDDRFLGVDMKAEVSRFFEYVGPAIPEDLMNDTVRHMISGDHPHPALLYHKKKITGHLFNAVPSLPTGDPAVVNPPEQTQPINRPPTNNAAGSPKKLILKHRLSPGDILVMSAAIRALHVAYPGQYLTDVRSPCSTIYANSPYITPLDENDPEVTVIDMQYPEIHKSGRSGLHFADGMRLYLAEQIGRPIPEDGIRPELFLTPAEKKQRVVRDATGYDGPYVVIDAGYKTDYSLKYYHYYQEVVDLLTEQGKQCVQIGVQASSHVHPQLNAAIDMIGQTDDHRKLFALIDQADVVITPVSYPMHIAAALHKPCVVVALGREAPRWEYYPDHQYLTVNGCLDCCSYDGCWKNTFEDCSHIALTLEDGRKVPLCQTLVKPEEICRTVMRYYDGNMIRPREKETDLGKVRIPNEVIINVLRILKPHNPGDPYLENYLGHIRKRGDSFYDLYHFIWEWVPDHYPRRILEIGTWTGNSLAQVLCAYVDYSAIERIVTCDLFDREETSPDIVRQNLSVLNIPEELIGRIEFLEGDSTQVVPMFQAANPGVKFDWILVDGGHFPHETPRKDLENVATMIAPGGVIVMDDLAPDGMSLQPVWDEFKAAHEDEFDWHENYDGKGVGYAIRR